MFTTRPRYIQFYPTLKCNISCSFCFNRGIPYQQEVSLGDFERILRIISEIGVESLDILGGEPTLHPSFTDMMNMVRGRRMTTNLSTNGSCDIALLEGLHDGDSETCIRTGVSINSDIISEELDRYIIRHRPVIKSLCTREKSIPEAVRRSLSRPGVEYYLLFMDVVQNEDLVKSLPFYEYYETLHIYRKTYSILKGVFCSGFIPDVKGDPVLEQVRCPAGTTKLSVLPDGSVYPCYLFFRDRRFRLGNILVDDFKEIWSNPILEFFRIFRGNACPDRTCTLFARCHGGCPAESQLFNGDLAGPDPRCIRPS